jgi:hypothetical protein
MTAIVVIDGQGTARGAVNHRHVHGMADCPRRPGCAAAGERNSDVFPFHIGLLQVSDSRVRPGNALL